MPATNIFLPFWKFIGAVFTWYLFVEGLKKLGLIKEGKSK